MRKSESVEHFEKNADGQLKGIPTGAACGRNAAFDEPKVNFIVVVVVVSAVWIVSATSLSLTSNVFESLIHTKSGAVSEADSSVQRWVSAN